MTSQGETIIRTENYDNEPDETIGERLIGLTEMIPAPIVEIGKLFWKTFEITCDASWVFFTTFAIVLGPAFYEAECQRLNRQQQTKTSSDNNKL